MTVHQLKIENSEEEQAQHEKTAIQILATAVVETLSQILPESAAVVERSTQDLTERFRSISASASKQSITIAEFVDLVSTYQVGNRKISFDEFVELFNQTLTEAVNRIIYISRNAIELVYSMDEAIIHLKDVDSFIGRIQRITSQTNLLALNAKIEAVRAGDVLGRNFGVVANEVKSLSRSVAELSNEMKGKLGKISQSVAASYEILREVANSDISNNIAAKDTLDQMILSMANQNGKLKVAIEESARTTNEISADINRMVVGIQFQDRNSQIMENAVIMLGNILEMANSISKKLPPSDNEDNKKALQELLASIKLGDIRHTCQKVCVNHGFLPPEVITEHKASSDSGSTDNDEIELF